ncbi:TetR/AcrR family transcriptional regulator [Bacillus songklensis]|uniref:TetR/AcrR family transcriptional regulator n=1 Tax=Bacillus songklensis TaxID=1069116 RepID=A0ABV8B2F6_9BACI
MAKPGVVSKKELIQSAKKCIAEKGIDKLTLKAVAEGAKVTQGTVYYHFRTKEQLLLQIVEDVCQESWQNVQQSPTDQRLEKALNGAKARCTKDAIYHSLFFSLVAAGLTQDKIRERIGKLLQEENEVLTNQLSESWKRSPIKGISFRDWGTLMNALIDGLALQALMNPDFSPERTYEAVEALVHYLQKEKGE